MFELQNDNVALSSRRLEEAKPREGPESGLTGFLFWARAIFSFLEIRHLFFLFSYCKFLSSCNEPFSTSCNDSFFELPHFFLFWPPAFFPFLSSCNCPSSSQNSLDLCWSRILPRLCSSSKSSWLSFRWRSWWWSWFEIVNEYDHNLK